MDIASITMVGQFPDGIDLHVRNLKWFLSNTDYHIYIITLPTVLEKINVKDDKVTFITKPTPGDDFIADSEKGFVSFWKWFPAIVKNYKIAPEWFLLMQQDFWFFEKFDGVPEPKTIKTFCPDNSVYHTVMLNDQVLQKHVWEGTHLISADVVNRAIDFNIDFGYNTSSFLDHNRDYYERLLGGKISISMWTRPETMSEFSLYCALEELVGWEETEKAVHLRGPETAHRRHPQIYNGCSQESLDEVKQPEIGYVNLYIPVAIYYIAGTWKDCKHIKWEKAGPIVWQTLRKVAGTADQWMTKEQHNRLLEVLNHLAKGA